MKEDPASLDRLHDLVLPPPVPWWPPAPGWMILLAVLAVLCLMFLVSRFMRWQADRYRREALALLDDPATPPAEWSAILKRAALAAWPREQTAHLTGKDWLAFLDRTAGMDLFLKGPARHLESIAFAPAGQADLVRLKTAAREWIIRHRKEVAP
ncbi:DUF4381 domain-containing protein [Luteolibacter yonseiensis]|uniref:DUF4381 domain-containing protein n=1 Tax=Luteolibacter yonseiensis TaxID=1144680 RepID=A0A934R0I0_9BACT|nr:DUF4381 domain-containing protein [Luteolibacter yonseiensis]MBK1814081.1 DUF4381 domain-containing protein [Luteolibacter yonseiensis]